MREFEPDEESITGINVTPLVDITLVLLIIFMVTARFLATPAFDVNLPRSSASSKQQNESNQVFLTMTQKGEIFLNQRRVSKENLKSEIETLLKEKPGMSLVFRADKKITHGDVVSILDQVRAAGVTQFGIAVEASR